MESLNSRSLLADLFGRYKPGSSYWVKVTHVNNPHSFYVRALECGALLENMEAQAPTSSGDVDIQDNITFKLNDSANPVRHVRGRIIATNENNGDITCDLIAIDYGYIKKSVPLNQISKYNETALNIPPLAMHCQLATCSAIDNCLVWSEEAIDAMKFYVGNGTARMEVVGYIPGKMSVNIVNSRSHDISILLALTGFSTLGYNHSTISRIVNSITVKKYYHFKNIKKNDTLHVRMQYGSSLEEFYVSEIEDLKNHQEYNDNILNADNSLNELPSDELRNDMPVYVLDDLGHCKRGIIRSCKHYQPTAVVQLVDSGEKLTTNISNIKSIPTSDLEHMAVAIYCCVEDHQLYDSSIKHILKPGCEFSITIREAGKELNTPNIVRITLFDKPETNLN